jgi:hypothetical protein
MQINMPTETIRNFCSSITHIIVNVSYATTKLPLILNMPLRNAFVESIVCVGFSSERGLKPSSDIKSDASLFSSFLQPSLLAVVTADRAIYPQSRSNDFIDPNYPPMSRSNSQSFTRSISACERSLPVPLSANTSMRGQKQYHISNAFHNLPMFCFPDGVKATYQYEPEKIHHIVFTQEEGKRSYALVLTFQQSFILKSSKLDDDGMFRIDDVKCASTITRRSSVSRIPVAVDRQKTIVPTSTASSNNKSTADKTRPRKIPSSFHYGDTSKTSKTRSTTPSDTSQQRYHYAAPTISSFMKKFVDDDTSVPHCFIRCPLNSSSLSSSSTQPTARVSRTHSQTDLSSSLTSATLPSSTGTSGMRRRSNSNSTATRSSFKTVESMSTTTNDITKSFYLPHCLVLVSSEPYWTVMQETISIIHDEIIGSRVELGSNAYRELIQKYALLACNTPVPPIPWERFSLSFNLKCDQSILTFDPAMHINRSILDLDLSILFLTLNIGKLLDVLAAILTQQPIIFFSSNYSTLVTTIECLLYLLYPLKWVHVYVPLVPDGLQDYYLEGPPGSYIMGAHERHQSIVEELNMCFVCNIDNEKNMYVPSQIEHHCIPPSKLQRFTGPITKLLDEIKTKRALQNIRTTVRLRLDQQREDERQDRYETNHRIIEIFFDFMVDLFGDALKPIYWKMNHQASSPTNTLTRTGSIETKHSSALSNAIFSKEKYLLSKLDGVEKEFYQAFVASTAFQLLMDEESVASTSSTAFRQICHTRSSTNEQQLYQFDSTSLNDDVNDDVDDQVNTIQ